MKPRLANRSGADPVAVARALDVGRRVLEGARKGGRIAQANAKPHMAKQAATIVTLVNADRAAGGPARGLAGRIARKMGMSERQILRRISDGPSSMSD